MTNAKTDNSSQLNYHPNIEGLTLFHAEPAPHEHKVHGHDAFSIIGLTHGRKQFHHNGQTIEVNANEIAIANPEELHGCGPINEQPWAHRTWYLTQELVCEISQGLGYESVLRLPSPVIRDQSIAAQLIQAHQQCTNEPEQLESQSLAIEALSNLFEQYAESTESSQFLDIVDRQECHQPREQRVEAYMACLQDRLSEQVELAELAAVGGVKRNQVIKDFKHVKGVTPGNFFRTMRLSRAKSLIRAGEDLATASLEAGFADQSHFTRSFKSAFGVTPNSYKRLSVESSGRSPL